MNGRLCDECAVAKHVDKLVAGPNGNPNPALEPLRKFLLEEDDRTAESIIDWVRDGRTAGVIKQMAAGDMPLSASAAASVQSPRVASYLASLLATAGVIPADDHRLRRFESWQRPVINGVQHASDRRALEQYARWVIGPRVRSGLSADHTTAFARERRNLLIAAEFLAYAHQQGLALATLPQRELDSLVARRGATFQRELGPFLRSARAANLTRLVVAPTRPSRTVAAISDDARWAQVRVLLHNERIKLTTRVGGLLILLFAQRVTRIVQLRPEDVEFRGSTAAVMLGSHPIDMPAEVGKLVLQVRRQAMMQRANQLWLFPGVLPSKHLQPASLRSALRSSGISVLSGRTSALIDLARTVPSPVIAELLGISTRAASDWATISSRGWATYPKLRSREPTSPATEGVR